MSRVLQSIHSGKVLITNPDRFFGELSGRESNLLAPFVIVLITAIIPAIAELLYYFHTTAAEIVVEVAPFVWWFLCAGASYVLSIFLGGVGSFKRVLEFTGYGFIPQILSAIFTTVVIYTLLPRLASLPQIMMYVIAIIGLLLFLWSVAIWVFAVKHARSLSTQDALFVVVCSVVVGLLLWWVIIGAMASIMN